MSNLQGNPQYVLVHKESNTLGTASFVLALLGFFSAGIFAPIALILSIVALQKQPKDLAVAGLIISLVTLPLAAAFWFVVIVPMYVIGSAVANAPAPQASAGPASRVVAPAPTVSVSGAKHFKAKTGGAYTVSMNLTNTSQVPVTRVSVQIEMVDFNGEVLAKDVFSTAIPTRLAPGASRPFEIDMPRYSPLNADMPGTAKARVTVLDVHS